MLRSLIICFWGLFLNWNSIAQPAPVFQKEVLKSGVTCYFIKTDEPTMDYYLIQNTGSALERPEEDGLAHLIEHLSFLSTAHFPGTVSAFFKRHQVENNASTYQDKIIYYMQKVPRNDWALNDSCLLVLHDWCGFLSIRPDEVEKEKMAIVEEWRGGRRPDQNQQEFARLLYNNTRFARLSSLGNMGFVRNVGNEQLRTFCREWFNPALAAIVVKGNFDVVEYRKKVEQLFEDIKVSPDYQKREPIVVPDNDSVYFRQISIPPNMVNTLLVCMRISDRPTQNAEDFCREKFYGELYNRMIVMRLEHYCNSQSARINNFTGRYIPIMKGYKMLHLEISPLPGYELSEFGKMMDCHYDLINHGLSAREQEILKQSYPYQFFLKKDSLNLIEVVENNYLRDYPLFTAEQYNQEVAKFAGHFNNEDFLKYCREQFMGKNTAVVAYCTPKAASILSRKAILEIAGNRMGEFPEINGKPVEVQVPVTGVLQKEEQMPEGDGVVWTYANGTKVVYQYLPGEDMQITAVRRGGLASFSAWDLAVGKALSPFINLMGTSVYQKQDLDDFVFTNGLKIDLKLNKDKALIKASSPVATCEALLKLLHLRLEDTRFEAVNPYMRSRIGMQLSTAEAGQDQYKAGLFREIYGPDKQVQQITRTYLDNVTPEKLKAAYNRTFGNARGWIYVIRGGVPVIQAKELMNLYVGSLSSDENSLLKPENRKFLVKKDIVRTVMLNTPDNNGGTDMNYVYPKPLEITDRILAEVLTKVLRNRCTQELRDVQSAIYGMYLETYGWNYPEPLTVLNINFGSKKEDQEPIASYIRDEFKRLAKDGVSLAEVTEACKMLNWEKLQQEAFIRECCEVGLLTPERLPEVRLMNRQLINPESVQRFARKFLSGSRTVRFVFR